MENTYSLVRKENKYSHWLVWVFLALIIGPFALLLILCPTTTYYVRLDGNSHVVPITEQGYKALQHTHKEMY